jgi:hypothetical protein
MNRYLLGMLVLVGCKEPQPPPTSTLMPTATSPVTIQPDVPGDSCRIEVTLLGPAEEADTDLRVQGYKSMCDVLAKSCGGQTNDDCRSFMDAYFASIQTGRGPFPVIHLDKIWTPPSNGWLFDLKPWQVFCVARARNAQEVRSCNTRLECKDPEPYKKL